MGDDYIKYTSFTLLFGQYEFLNMLFSLSGSPASFQKVISSTLFDIEDFIIYIDDILINSESEIEHIKTLKRVLKRLKDNNITIKKGKIFFEKENISYLGYEISKKGYKINLSHINLSKLEKF